MKLMNIKTTVLLMCMALVISSCFDDREILFEETQIEFESAVTLARATGEIFPIINLTRASGTPNYQVNLIGSHLASAEAISFSVEEVPDRLLNANTIRAEQGVHYTLSGNSFSFPVNTSTTNFNGLSIVPGFPAQAGRTALLIIKLDGNENVKPSENFRRLAFRISLN